MTDEVKTHLLNVTEAVATELVEAREDSATAYETLGEDWKVMLTLRDPSVAEALGEMAHETVGEMVTNNGYSIDWQRKAQLACFHEGYAQGVEYVLSLLQAYRLGQQLAAAKGEKT